MTSILSKSDGDDNSHDDLLSVPRISSKPIGIVTLASISEILWVDTVSQYGCSQVGGVPLSVTNRGQRITRAREPDCDIVAVRW